MTEKVTKTIDLIVGYKDQPTRVTFSHRIKGKDFFDLDADPTGQNPTQYQDLVMSVAITEFGSLRLTGENGERIRVPLSVLLSLDSLDREDLTDAHNEFQHLSAGEREAEFLPDHSVKLAFGFTLNGIVYDHVKFGRRLTGVDQVNADNKELTGVKRLCYLIGQQISKIYAGDGSAELDGPVSLEMFEALDGADITTLRTASEIWRQSFRHRRKELQEKRDGADGAASSEVHEGVERGVDTSAPSGSS